MGNCFGASKKTKKGGYHSEDEPDIEMERSRQVKEEAPDEHTPATKQTLETYFKGSVSGK